MAETSAGATPVVPGATPGQTPPAAPVDPAPATGPDDDQDGVAALSDPGKQALDRMKAARKAAEDRAKAAEAELDKLRTATLSETERAIAEAKAAGASEATAKADARVRRAEVRTALTAAGVNPKLLDIVAKADEFAELKVADDGEVEGLKDAVSAFRKANPDLFGQATHPGADLGASGVGGRGLTLAEIRAMSPAEHSARRAEVMAFLAKSS